MTLMVALSIIFKQSMCPAAILTEVEEIQIFFIPKIVKRDK